MGAELERLTKGTGKYMEGLEAIDQVMGTHLGTQAKLKLKQKNC